MSLALFKNSASRWIGQVSNAVNLNVIAKRWVRPQYTKIDAILIKDYPSLGFRGDQVAVKPGYIRNFLYPQKIAVYATEENKAKFLREKTKEELSRIENEIKLAAIRKRLAKLTISFKRHCTEGDKLYGSVTLQNILDNMRKNGMEVAENAIQLPEPIKTLGEFPIDVRLPTGDTAQIKVSVVRR
eukprot:CAMPEP_0113698616 /NCGR_PEP_ID=MMETSP0038_2-20120614/22811_1 /TAXON_ID=2898 /ORGANISM="Cryptomonas paramecium" /LENGTH=184 /DNA_ID=CAMNT_0000621803 /DNA_START=6 /DNA_END=560 /DNA_ORIENTATION=+ /assembly_acc=CAM_ASM_000170